MTTDDTRPLGLRLPRSNWPETYTAQEAKAWIAAMDAAEALLYDEGIVDDLGYTTTLDAERARHAALVAAARALVDAAEALEAWDERAAKEYHSTGWVIPSEEADPLVKRHVNAIDALRAALDGEGKP